MSWSATLSANSYQSRGFWARQFSAVETQRQTRFDAVFGVILPITVLILDPLVFQGDFFNHGPLLGNYQIFAYLLCGFQMGLFLLWRSIGRNLGEISALIGGALVGGAIFSFVVGLMILPYSAVGLLVLIGAAGFTPFVTSFVYLRNGIRALRSQSRNYSFETRAHMAAWALVFALLLPYVVGAGYSNLISTAVNQLIYSDPDDVAVAARTLRLFPVIPSSERHRVYDAYREERSFVKRFALEQYWKDITGEDLRLRPMPD
jgi:hypothetical protein